MKRPSVRELSSIPSGRAATKGTGGAWIARSLAHLAGFAMLFLVAAGGIYIAGLVAAGFLLVERNAPESADVIVVLGGDGRPRAERAAGLWNEGLAPLVLATGYGDCNFVRAVLIAEGVDAAA